MTWRRPFAMFFRIMTCLLMLLTGKAVAQECGEYEVTAIVTMDECPPFGIPPVVPLGINEEGWMVGFFQPCVIGADRAFLWTPDDGLVVIPTPSGTSYSRAVAISGSLIVGEYDNSELELGRTGFLYNYDTNEFTSLSTLPGGDWSEAHAINSSGQIVGFWKNSQVGPRHAFIYENGIMQSLGDDLGTPNSQANDINANGLITGWMGTSLGTDARAFIWDEGNVTSLPPIPGGFTSKGNQINTTGQITITGNFNDDHPLGFIGGGFLWESGEWTDLGMLEGYDSMALKGLNEKGTIVGWSRDIQQGQNPDTGFVWQNGVMTNINDLIQSGAQLQIERANGINGSGQITAQAHSDPLDATVAVIMSPIVGLPGDLNGDCQITIRDLLVLLGYWGSCDVCALCPADLNQDCAVGVSDLLILLANWG